MLHKLLNPFRFGTFYHEFDIGISPEHFKRQTCKLATYVGAYRKYGHYYSNLDPLSLYNWYAMLYLAQKRTL
jgi:2-oxoglutarate dehydrogenase complex dehydrogenase (E1) component-like enzyme